MNIGISNDHRGVILKNVLKAYLTKKGYNVIDLGTDTPDSVDYPDYAFKLGEALNSGEIDKGIAICGTGIGISIACNKVKGIRAAKADSIKDAFLARNDNDANVLALNGSMPKYLAKDIVDKFLNTHFSMEERHIDRINKITEYENKKKNRKKIEKEVDNKDEC